MVNLGIGFKELLTRPGIKKHLLFDLATRRINKFQLATKCCDSEKMSCHVILKNLYEPEMDVILTITFKVTAEIEITKHVFASYFADEDVYRHFVKHNYVLSLNYCHGIYIVFFTVNSSNNAAQSSLYAVCRQKLHGKSIQLTTFPQGKVISPCGVVVNKVLW